MLNYVIIIFCILCIAISFVLTFKLGVAQNPAQNEKYNQNRRKTVLLLIVIYGVAVLIGVALIYTYY